jgi:hypothetical protein
LDEYAWNSTTHHPMVVSDSMWPNDAKFWSTISTCGWFKSPIIQMDGFSMVIAVQSGYMVFILADPTKHVILESSKWMAEQNMLERDLGWEVVIVPAGSTLYVLKPSFTLL